jgi:cysteinyl-tRNA synthetase
MDDDFNTPEALAVLFDLANEANRSKSPELSGQLKVLAGVIGLLEADPTAFLQESAGSGDGDSEINQLIIARNDFKKARNYGEADRIRKQLLDSGIVLEDTPQGTTWRRG